ncbi:hypothetical protein IGI04_036410 [Brassica rapa subsp. trilocularis]|uniref:Uncharacterized protein n=1 Tax=Brassica rapa subsp. trilocularis TaxID=1813537 RepID=A0ABQ7LH42_BRACM|nr:hypothetical protein IGI04_036410 [Brassica rapa subsp. trilocularis]
MIGQPMIPHSFNIHHPSQAITQTHTGQRQAYTNQIHTKPNPVPKQDLRLNGSITLYDTLTQHSNLGPGDFVFLLSIGNILSPYHKGQKKELSTDRGPHGIHTKPTHSVLGEKQLVDRRGLGQNPRDALTGLD